MVGIVLSNTLMGNTPRLTSPFTRFLLIFIVILYSLSILYGVVLRWIRRYLIFFYVQLAIDLLAISLAVHITGGSSSGYTALFLISIVGASIIDVKRGALLSGIASTLLFLSVSILGYKKILPALPDQLVAPWEVLPDAFYKNLGLNIAAFIAVSVLSSQLGELLQRAGKEVKDHKQALDDLSKHHEQILHFLHSGIVSTDQDGLVQSMNAAAERILGVQRDEAVKTPIKDLLPTEVLNKRNVKTTLKGSNPSPIPVEISTTSYWNENNEKQGIIYHLSDRSEIEEMEKEVQKNERLAMLGRFAAGIAHEIRNPLASMSGSIELLKQSASPQGEDSRLMNILYREVERLDHLISDLLVFARPRPVEFEPLSLKKIVSKTIDLFKQKQGDLEISFEAKEKGGIQGDADKLRQVFLNLLVNASEAVGPKGHIHIAVFADPHDKDTACVVVEDDGKGMSEEEMTRMFEPFYTTKGSGTGLGLSMVYQIVKDHGGKIKVSSTNDEGTRIEVRLPSLPRLNKRG